MISAKIHNALGKILYGVRKIKFTLNTSVENQRTKNALVFDHFQV